MKPLLTIALTAMAVALTAPAALAAPEDPSDRMVERINDVRSKHGLPPMRVAPKLARSSSAFARHILRTDDFSHGTSYQRAGFRHAGEAIAMRRGWNRNAKPTLRQWLDSPGHAALILDPSFRYVGASPARGRFGGVPTTIWVAQFGGR